MGFGKDGKGIMLRESSSITLVTLGSGVAIKSAGQLVLQEDFRTMKQQTFMQYEGHTVTEGPIIVGIADNELSVAEIAEALSVDGPLDKNDRSNVERVERAVFPLAMLDSNNASGTVGPSDGTPLETKLRWTFSNPEGWVWFAFNNDVSGLTDGTIIRFLTTHYGVWVT